VNPSPPTDPPPAPPPPGYPADLERSWLTSDGTAVRIRALHPGDLDLELDFIAGLSPETLYQRLHYRVSSINREEAARLLELDYRDTLACGALVDRPSGPSLIGVSRYARVAGTDSADCAIVVADAWHGRGIGTELMRSLAVAARQRGIRALVGSSLADNTRIHAWARRFGFEVQTEPNSGGEVRITVDLSNLAS
jgi:acetyltransferase